MESLARPGRRLKLDLKCLYEAYDKAEDKLTFINEVRLMLHDLSPNGSQPVDYVQWVPLEKVRANEYNPNAVAQIELQLLFVSIDHDGYTQPIVTVYDKDNDEYIIVDGFHRYFILKAKEELQERTHGCLPVVVINKDINDRMASTIRHNRARGKHTVQGMSSLVFEMLDNGWSDEEICNELGMEPEELLRLKHITGFSKLFADIEYKKAWMSKRQIELKKKYESV